MNVKNEAYKFTKNVKINLTAEDLLCWYGFNDGNILDLFDDYSMSIWEKEGSSFMDDKFRNEFVKYLYDGIDDKELQFNIEQIILIILVEVFLKPRLDSRVELETVCCGHNPIRATDETKHYVDESIEVTLPSHALLECVDFVCSRLSAHKHYKWLKAYGKSPVPFFKKG